MTSAVLPSPARVPAPTRAAQPIPTPCAAEAGTDSCSAVAYQRVLHSDGPPRVPRAGSSGSRGRTPTTPGAAAELSRHADLLRAGCSSSTTRTERRPALARAVPRGIPADDQDAAREHIAAWTSRTALLDHSAPRPVDPSPASGARSLTAPSHLRAFLRAVGRLWPRPWTRRPTTDERDLLPLVRAHLHGHRRTRGHADREVHSWPASEQMLVLGLAAGGRLRHRPRPHARRSQTRRPHRLASARTPQLPSCRRPPARCSARWLSALVT